MTGTQLHSLAAVDADLRATCSLLTRAERDLDGIRHAALWQRVDVLLDRRLAARKVPA